MLESPSELRLIGLQSRDQFNMPQRALKLKSKVSTQISVRADICPSVSFPEYLWLFFWERHVAAQSDGSLALLCLRTSQTEFSSMCWEELGSKSVSISMSVSSLFVLPHLCLELMNDIMTLHGYFYPYEYQMIYLMGPQPERGKDYWGLLNQ